MRKLFMSGLIVLGLIFSISTLSYGVPAAPVIHTLTQADGTYAMQGNDGSFVSSAHGQGAEGLFSDAGSLSDSYIQKQVEKQDPTVVRSRWVKVNFDQLVGEGLPEGAETIFLNLFDDFSLITVKDRLEKRSKGRYSWFGKILGMQLGQVILVVEDGVMAGNITVNGQLYQVRAVGEGIHVVREIDQSRFPDEAPPIPIITPPDIFEPSSLYSPLDDGSTIDILVVYTSAAASDSSNIVSEIQLAIDGTNQSYINSGINQRVRLVHSAQINYTETGNGETDLGRLSSTSDGYMDDVHTLRDQYCADIVSLWVKEIGDYCGLGYLMYTVSTSFASQAFYVVERSCATGNFSFAHEMGHNMGAHHDRYVAPENGAYSYSHGYVYTANKWRTIMAYNDACAAQGFNCTRIQYWSNPDVNYGGVPTGVSSTSSSSADNRLTLNNTANTVANFRQSCSTQQKPNLTPYKPSGWSDKIVVSNKTGTNTDDSPLYITDTLYVDWAIINNGAAKASATFYTKLYVDGVEKNQWPTNTLDVNITFTVLDYSIGTLSAGTHTIKIVTDATGVISESDELDNESGSESDNEYTKTITVNPAPSCSSLYFWDGDEYVYGRSLFPGALFVENKYRDYVPLRNLVPKDGRYYLRIMEEEQERAFIDMVYLVVIDRSLNGEADVLADVGSEGSIIRKVTLYPSSATHSVLGNVRRELLYAEDKYVRMDTGDILTLTFPYVPEVGTTREFIFVAEGFYTLSEK